MQPPRQQSRRKIPASLTKSERAVLSRLRTPADIQAFLDGVAYSDEPVYRSPRSVLRDRKAHCFDGAVFAALALECAGFAPLVVDYRAERDDDHVVAVFAVRGHWGAIGKSNYVGLRFREPIHRTMRELALSYFDAYFNPAREKTMRSYTRPIDLRRLRAEAWRTDDAAMETIAAALDRAVHQPVLKPWMAARLQPVDERSFHAHLQGANPKGLYQPQ